MDDLKLEGKNDYKFDRLLKIVTIFSDDVGMAFGLVPKHHLLGENWNILAPLY